MKHQYEEYIKFVDEMIADTGDDHSFYFNTAFRASLLANKATLEGHKPKPTMGGNLLPKFLCADSCGYFPCPSLLDVTNQLDEVM